MRAIAFYLPQFHPIPENDRWWSPGFTEWTNVVRARPLFPGHEQPHLPGELGFYDLRLPATRAAQADLARAHGIEAFCYWHYWFAGARLLERPFAEVLSSGEPDFPFCLAWANESWSGVWHGAPDRILMEQTYPGPSDDEAHFRFLLEAFRDPRYLTVDGCPLVAVLKPRRLPEPRRTTDCWRDLARRAGLPGLHLVAIAQAESAWDPAPLGFDAVAISNQTKICHRPSTGLVDAIGRRVGRTWRRVRGWPAEVHAYADALPYFLEDPLPDVTRYPCIVSGWDNTPRSGRRGVVLRDPTPALFATHAAQAMAQVASYPAERQIVFVKSWNEWAEGNTMEPDHRWGRGFLEALRDVVATA
ncbi:MAG TPA: glycoside hydrolase family 99-like domain-containing protein [Candidatus Binatia bacterium]|jgi:hypothetical protein|nr:glycoside hydrolase family 99-like domain-containing protein [Candidatus Binatia bacterium]